MTVHSADGQIDGIAVKVDSIVFARIGESDF